MDDASSDFSDWEVLSAASAAGGDDGDDDVVLVSGHVLHDHFATDPSPPAGSEAVSEADSGSRSPGRSGSISPEPTDLIATAQQPRLGGADVTATATARGQVLGASLARGGATWPAQEEKAEEALVGAGSEAARGGGEPDSIPAHQGADGISGSDAAAADGLGLHTDNSTVQLEDSIVQLEDSTVQLEDSTVQLEDGGADPVTESSGLEAAATGDAVHAAPDETQQGEDASAAASGCGEPDGDDKDRSSPLVNGEGERQVVVWWRLPFRLIHYCAWKVRPVWSISIAAALLGMVVLGRRMYRMRRKARGLPQIKIAFDDKRASQFADRAARLNEAFLIAKRVPALRTSSGAALPWSMMQER